MPHRIYGQRTKALRRNGDAEFIFIDFWEEMASILPSKELKKVAVILKKYGLEETN